MSAPTTEELTRKKCRACEGGVPPLSDVEANEWLASVPHWSLAPDGKSIERCWTVRNFLAGIAFFDTLAALAEAEGHHPDLHLEGYRNVRVALSTHALGGLSENDFILAAKINEMPIEEKKAKSG